MDASSRLSGYSAAHIPALLRICGTTEGSEARDQALKHRDALLVRDETHRNKSNPDFKARLSKFALSGAALRAKDAGDPLVFPTEAWDLLRALMVLNPATTADYFVRGRIIGRRTDQDALAEYRNVIYNVAGKGGAPPFGAITFSKPALSLSEALRNAPRLWLEFLRGPARSFIGFLPRQLPRPMFDEKQVAEFLDYSRDSLIIPAGKAGRYLLKAMMDHWRRRYVWRKQHVDGPLLTQLLCCCRHDQPPSVSVVVGDHMRERGDAAPCGPGAEMLGEAGAAADSRPSSSVAGTLSGAFVAKALARALNLVETDGKKGAIGTGCQASLKLVFCDSADVVLVMRGAASHNHSAESDDIFFPLHPGVLEYVHKSLQKKRDPLALTNVSREIRAANMVLSHQYKLLLRHGPNAAVLATIAPTVIGAPPSAGRERSRGIGPPLPSVIVAAAKTIAAHDDSVFADPVICYCGGSFDVAKDEVPISCRVLGMTEYPTLLGRRVPHRVAILLEESVPVAVCDALEPLFTTAARDALALCDCNQVLRRVLCDHGLSTLTAGDFGTSSPPKVGVIYVELVTMSAQWWHAEAQRVLVRGETTSKMSHRPHHLAFKVVLARMMPLAAAAVAAGRGDMPLTGLYIGQEMRKEGSLGGRWQEHTGSGGCENIMELACRTSKRPIGRIVTPLGGPVVVECRFLAVTAPTAERVDFAEDALRCLLHMAPGVVLLNSSPASGDRRYLHEMPAGPALVNDALSALLEENETGRIRMASRLPGDGVPPFLRDVLVTAGHLLKAGRFCGDDGQVLRPELDVGGRVGAGGGGLDFSQLQCASTLLAGEKSEPRHVLLLLNACTCARLTPVCECMLACRIVHEESGLPSVWRDLESELHGLGRARAMGRQLSAAAAITTEAEAVSAGARHAQQQQQERQQSDVTDLLMLTTLVPELPDDKRAIISSQLEKMAATVLQWQCEHSSGASGSHANVHLHAHRSTTAAQVKEQNRRQRLLFYRPPDAISRLHAGLQVSALECSGVPPPPLPTDAPSRAAGSAQWRAIFSAGIASASAAASRVGIQAASSAIAAANAAAVDSSYSAATAFISGVAIEGSSASAYASNTFGMLLDDAVDDQDASGPAGDHVVPESAVDGGAGVPEGASGDPPESALPVGANREPKRRRTS